METVRIPRVLQDSLKKARLHGRSIGLVPTMGALHEGHLNLVRMSIVENDITVVSIFVNPLQFGPSEDYERYPRDTEGDAEKLRVLGVDILFLPDAPAIYPEGFLTSIDIKGLSDKLCGRFRPGHFTGVATVVTKLFNIVGPTRAYFGQKDYQQCLIIKRLIKDLDMEIELVVYPTVREPDGMAMSSRNRHLSPEGRRAATVLFRCLKEASEKITVGGVSSAVEVRDFMHSILRTEPLMEELQYASVYDPESLDELTSIKGRTLLAIAVKIEGIRLIDNMLVEKI